MSSLFNCVREAAPIEIFELSEACKRDPSCDKVDMTLGAYRTNEGSPYVLPVVRLVEQSMAADVTLNKEYLPVTGLSSLCLSSTRLLLGNDNPLISTKKADGCQSLGGTGAFYLALKFLKHVLQCKVAYVSRPTWPNHKGICKFVGLDLQEYRYWDEGRRIVDFDGLIKDLNRAPENGIVVLHACAHNPTGMDLSKEQWKCLAALIKERKLFPVFDVAYQGFSSGDLDDDAWAVRYFASQGFELFACQSFSKNFGLYNERIGNLVFITHDPVQTAHVKSQLKLIVRQTWSNPPQHGARIVSTILNDPQLFLEWKKCLINMAGRSAEMRVMLYEKLRVLGTPGTWDHLVKQNGLFSFTGLSEAQCKHMIQHHHIYMLIDGRMNMCGLTTKNIDYVAQAVHETVLKVTE